MGIKTSHAIKGETTMTLKTLRTWNDDTVLFTGDFDTWQTCVAAAIDAGIVLDYLTLSDCDVTHANWDGAQMNYAKFVRCDLTGANLSEASLIKTIFEDCALNDVCLSDTVAVGGRFMGSSMARIDVHYADLRGILVTCPEFLKIDFSNTAHMASSAFMAHGVMCPMTRRPVFLRGLGLDMVMLDEHIVLGNMMVLRRDQMRSRDGLAHAFGKNGLQPNPDTLAALWDTIHTMAA
jgi:hypothetical protein